MSLNVKDETKFYNPSPISSLSNSTPPLHTIRKHSNHSTEEDINRQRDARYNNNYYGESSFSSDISELSISELSSSRPGDFSTVSRSSSRASSASVDHILSQLQEAQGNLRKTYTSLSQKNKKKYIVREKEKMQVLSNIVSLMDNSKTEHKNNIEKYNEKDDSVIVVEKELRSLEIRLSKLEVKLLFFL